LIYIAPLPTATYKLKIAIFYTAPDLYLPYDTIQYDTIEEFNVD